MRLQALGFTLGTVGMGLGFQLVEGQWATDNTCECCALLVSNPQHAWCLTRNTISLFPDMHAW